MTDSEEPCRWEEFEDDKYYCSAMVCYSSFKCKARDKEGNPNYA